MGARANATARECTYTYGPNIALCCVTIVDTERAVEVDVHRKGKLRERSPYPLIPHLLNAPFLSVPHRYLSLCLHL